jgi:hypothetical protein
LENCQWCRELSFAGAVILKVKKIKKCASSALQISPQYKGMDDRLYLPRLYFGIGMANESTEEGDSAFN